MKPFKNTNRTVSNFFSMLIGNGQKKSDHKTLSRHIIKLNQKKSPAQVIRQSAGCLKEIAHYRLFAFAIKTNRQTNAWIDPDLCKETLEKIIRQDFNMFGHEQLNLMLINKPAPPSATKVKMADLVSYVIFQPDFKAKIYMIPGKTMFPYHDEIAELVLKSTSVALARQMEIQDLSSAATIDPLTGCYNRREFENQLKKNIHESIRHKTKLSVFMFDLDYFKRVNDQYGHLAGDAVLKTIACLISENMRKGDILARYGGEEFIAILPRTGKNKAIELADRLRIKIMNQATPYQDKNIKVTASFGVAELSQDNTDMNNLIKKADNMLYKAKIKGRNMVMPGLMKIISTTKNSFSSKTKIL